MFSQGHTLGTNSPLPSHTQQHTCLLSAFIHPIKLTDVIPVRFHHIPQLSGAHMLLKRENEKKKINSVVSLSNWGYFATLLSQHEVSHFHNYLKKKRIGIHTANTFLQFSLLWLFTCHLTCFKKEIYCCFKCTI